LYSKNQVGNPKNLICPLLVNLSFWATRFEWVASKKLPICSARQVELNCVTPFEENQIYRPANEVGDITRVPRLHRFTAQSFKSTVLLIDKPLKLRKEILENN